MLRKRLAATVAVAPLLFVAHAALADTTVNSATTTPLTTSTAGNVTVDSGGSIKPTTATPAITVNDNSSVTINSGGTIATSGVDNSTGVQITAPGAAAGNIVNAGGAITLDDNFTPVDSDNDGDLDGDYYKGTGRTAIRLNSGGAYTGSIRNNSGGTITVEGADSRGISVESDIIGTFDIDSTHDTNIAVLQGGTITVTGLNAKGVYVASTATVTGQVRVQGSASVTQALGQGAEGVGIDGNVSGALILQGTIESTGYSTAINPNVGFGGIARPLTADLRAKLEAEDKLQGGSAVRVGGNVGGGILVDKAPTISSSTTDDGDGDGIKDSADTDQDNDGVTDTAEGSGFLATFGSAPTLKIGAAGQNIVIGNYGAGADNYGLVVRGSVFSNGLYDGVNSTAIQIGDAGGGTTDLSNGANISGVITSIAYEANGTAIDIQAGAIVPNLLVTGTTAVTVSSDGYVAGTLNANGNNAATGILIHDQANVTSITVAGTMNVSVGGEKVDAIGIMDLSGSVTSIVNSGRIITSITPTDDAQDTDDADTDPTNEVIHGTQTAIDVSHALNGVSVVQVGPSAHLSSDTTDKDGDGVYDADEPVMVGDIKFGAHDDTLDIRSGAVVGAVSFGDGNDQLLLSNASIFAGALSDSDGHLDIALSGTATTGSILTITNPTTIAATSVTATGKSSLIFTAEPSAGSNHTQLNVDTANLQAGTSIGLRFANLLVTDQSYVVIDAAHMTAGSIVTDGTGATPYMYNIVAHTVGSTSGGAGQVVVDASRKTATQLGLNKEGAAAYSAVYGALFNDESIRNAFLAQTTSGGFSGVFDQMLPNNGQGIFSALMVAGQSASDGIAQRPDPHQRYGPDSFWVQEINTRIQRDTADTEGSDTKAFGFVSGYESMGDGGALGITMSYVTAEERGSSAAVGEQSSASLFEGGLYYRGYRGNLTFMLRGGVGYVRMESDRKFVYTTCSTAATSPGCLPDTTSINKTASSRWNGFTGSFGADVAYEARFGRFYARPSAGLDYLYFSEGGHSESGGGTGFDLTYDGRSSSRLDAEAILEIGAEFGRDNWWRPELRVGYRQRLAGTLGDTVVRFSGGTPFSISGGDKRDGALVLGFSLKTGTAMSYLALEGDSEISDLEMRYLIRLVGRVMF